MVIKWMKRLKWMRISKYAIIICLLLSLIFAGFTVYGAKTGNFNVYVQPSDVNIAIYMEEDKSDLGTHLSVPMLEDMEDCTYEWLNLPYYQNKILPGLGSKNDKSYREFMCFSFVLVNLSDRAVDYDMQLTVVKSRDGEGGGKVAEAMRILMFREDDFSGGKIYAMPEKSEEDKKQLTDNTDYETIDFISPVQIFATSDTGLVVGGEIKFTFVMWLEGWDVDCVDDLFKGRIQMRLDITGI